MRGIVYPIFRMRDENQILLIHEGCQKDFSQICLVDSSNIEEVVEPLTVFGWRAAGVEWSRPSFWGRLPPLSSLVANVGMELFRLSFCLVGGMRYRMDSNFDSVSGSHMS
jgi:hypothetical protein